MNNIDKSLIYAGIGENDRKITLNFNGKQWHFKKKIHGLVGLVKEFPLDTLARDWNGFLNGEPLYLPENEIVFRTTASFIPDRKAAEEVMHSILKKDSPYLEFSKMDGILDVRGEVDESSVKLAYYRRQKVNPDGKVFMRFKFALSVQLKKPIQAADVSEFNTKPFELHINDVQFYPRMKAILAHHEDFCTCDDGRFIIKKATSEGESNCRFALQHASDDPMNFFKFLDFWLYANQDNPDADILRKHQASRDGKYSWMAHSSTSRMYYLPLIYISGVANKFSKKNRVSAKDLENSLTFISGLTGKRMLELSSAEGYGTSLYRKFGCVDVQFTGSTRSSFHDEFQAAKDDAVQSLNLMLKIYREAEEYIKNNLAKDWHDFTEGCEIHLADGSEIPDLDKYGIMLVAQAISLDPQLFLDEKGPFSQFAHCRVLGEFYNG